MSTHLKVQRALPALLCLALLSACGGGGGTDTASTTGATETTTPTASAMSSAGTLTGFGSVIVDGTEVDDSTATVCTEDIGGTVCNTGTKLQLGQRLHLQQSSTGKPSTITVAAGVIGVVSNKSTTSITVAAQRVTVNTDASAGPVTVFGGTTSAGVAVTSLDDISNGDMVEVHGTPVYNATSKAYDLVATRIEAKSAINHVRMLGKVAGLAGSTFTLNGIAIDTSAATIAPTGTKLADGQSVIVFVPAANGVVTPTTLGWPAKRVLVLSRDIGTTGSIAALGGSVSKCNSTSACTTFEVGGLTVEVGSAKVTPTGATIKDGSYVRVAGTMGADGKVAASRIHVRQADTDDDLARVRLLGAIDSVDSTNNKLIVVRGVPVDTTSATLKSCPSTGLVSGSFVDVKAQIQSGTDVVLAREVRCGSKEEAQTHRSTGNEASAQAYTATTGHSDTKGWGKYLKRQQR